MAINLGPGDPPLTLAEVAEHYRMPERQLRALIRQKQVEVLRYGRTVRFDRHALDSLEEAMRRRAPEQAPGQSRSSARSRERDAYERALRATILGSRRKKPTLDGRDRGDA